MQTEIRDTKGIAPQNWDLPFKNRFDEKGTLVNPEDSACKCVDIVQKDTFKSGSHIDFYDQ